jgi:hypothetical protein
MNRLLSNIFLFIVCAAACVASADTLKKGIPGSYSRLLGMESTVIELRRDGVYVITTQGCVWSDEGKGQWTVKDSSLILDGRGHPKGKKDKLTKFTIVVLDGDIALRPQNDVFESEDHESADWLFKPVKKG